MLYKHFKSKKSMTQALGYLLFLMIPLLSLKP